MTIALRPMPAESLPAWIEVVRCDYEQSLISSGDSVPVAAEKARLSTDLSFPDGVAGPGQLVYDVVSIDDNAGNIVVGHLWISRLERGDAWWVSDIKIDENHRGEGYGRAAMQLAEIAAAEHGAMTLGLNVFGYNTVARSLYESLGYETTAAQMRKPVRL